MKLIRFDNDRTGLVVELPSGPWVIDVVASIGALTPEDPISHGVLNGILKDNGNWASLIQHWRIARAGLRRLAVLARMGSPQIVLRRSSEVRSTPSRCSEEIVSLDIGECGTVAPEPTGREIMERQFTGHSMDPTGREIMLSQSSGSLREAERTDNRIVVLSDVRTTPR
jgi:hypothetical protein